MAENGESPRGRLILVGCVVLVVLLASGALIAFVGDGTPLEHTYAAAPAPCVTAWNDDLAARYLGRHQFTFHRYTQIQILTLSADGTRAMPADAPGATCAIVFAASSLDPEFAAAAVIKRPAAWLPLSGSASPNRLAELQSAAKTAYNGNLHEDGSVTALPPP